MKVHTVEFVGSFGFPKDYPREMRPEIAFFGRSNVGKSTLINTLLGRRQVARTSKTPGKTRSANYFRINDRFLFVDMPGYGYAKVSKTEKRRWKTVIDGYLGSRPNAKGVVQILDIRRLPTPDDLDMASALRVTGRRLCLVFNKIDKVSSTSIDSRIAESLRSVEVGEDAAVVPFSSVSGAGRQALWGWIHEVLSL